jgi:nitrite reductase/ring-hydroxylating ferredoxin subunit
MGADMTEEHYVCPEEKIPSGDFLITEINEKSIGFTRIDGEICAILNHCPHQGADICEGSLGGTIVPSEVGTYDYGADNRVLRCPWHAWEFDVTSGDGIYPGNENIPTYETVVRDGNVYVEL